MFGDAVTMKTPSVNTQVCKQMFHLSETRSACQLLIKSITIAVELSLL